MLMTDEFTQILELFFNFFFIFLNLFRQTEYSILDDFQIDLNKNLR